MEDFMSWNKDERREKFQLKQKKEKKKKERRQEKDFERNGNWKSIYEQQAIMDEYLDEI
jgi:hypothetical protein